MFCVWQAKRHRGARIVNEPGSLNFNDLNTRDVAGAKSFYGSVFGWETLGLEGGFEMWTLPGYGDHLERDNPGLRDQVAATGGPAGFEDVVASINPIADDQPDVPAHWGVTFAVDDADATAAKARELGGTVVVPLFDAPWVRMTVLTDLQGATFVASKYVPENRTSVARRAPTSEPPREAGRRLRGGPPTNSALLRRAFSVDGSSRERGRSFGWCGQSMRSVEGEHRWEDDNDRGGQQGEKEGRWSASARAGGACCAG